MTPPMDLWQAIAETITEATGKPFTVRDHQEVGGGCINRACRVSDGKRAYFVKLNQSARLDMFAAEAAGLEAILRTNTLRAPRPLGYGSAGDQAFLVLEYLETGHGGRDSMVLLGRGLAAMHRHSTPHYGWERDNTIGSTPQPNPPEQDWVRFWQHHRLGHQLELAAAAGYGGRLQERGRRLLEVVPAFFPGPPHPPSLLHGDLWSGNYAVLHTGEPVIFDPAVYYGDREADLAMTELFGGFPEAFYAAYREAWPLPPEYAVRKTLYNLYHILNHLNLFGGGYRSQAETMIDRLLAEAGR